MEILEFKKLDLSEYKSLGDFDIKRIDKNILIIYKDHKYGLLSLDGKIIKNPIFKSIGKFEDNLACVQYDDTPEFGVIDETGNAILTSIYKFNIDGKYIVYDALYYENNYTIFDKRGNLLFSNINDHINDYSNDLFIRRTYDSFYYYDVIDVNNKKITSIKKYYDRKTLYSKGILVYKNKGNINVIDPTTHKIRKFKCQSLQIINSNRYLILNKNNLWQIIDNNGKVIKDIQIGKDLKVINHEIILKSANNINYYSGFINKSLDSIDIKFDTCKIVSENRMIISSDNKYALIDFSGKFLIPYSDYKIKYDNNSNCYILNKDHKYIVLSEELDKIFECNKEDLKVITKDLFLVKDSKVLLVNANNEVLKEFNDNIDDIDIYTKGELINISTKSGHSLITKNKIELISEVDDDIVIIDENKVAVNNCIIDLNKEFISLKINYIVKFDLFGKEFIRKFENIKEKDLFINKIVEIEKEYYNKVKELKNDTINSINNASVKVKRK